MWQWLVSFTKSLRVKLDLNLLSKRKSENQPQTVGVATSAPSNKPSTTAERSDESSPQLTAKLIGNHRRWKRRREIWVPILNMTVGVLAFAVLFGQSCIMDRQTDILSTQTKVMEDSLRISMDSLRVSVDTLGTSQQSFQMSERAYVGVASLTANTNAGEVLIMLHNIGNVPARAITLEGQEIRVTPLNNMERTKSGERVNENQEGSLFRWTAGEVQLFPGTPMLVVVPMRRFKKEERNAILKKKEILYIGGMIQYEDGFGKRQNTTFAFRYTPPPNERWTAHSDLSKILLQQRNPQE